MRRIRYKKTKTNPNYFEYTGIHTQTPVEIQLFEYNENHVSEWVDISVQDIKNIFSQSHNSILWLNIHGLHNTEIIQELSKILAIENHIVGEILNTNKRSRMEEFDDMLFISLKSLLPNKTDESFEIEQISFILKSNILITFQEKRSDTFALIRERIRNNIGLARKKQIDYLLYLMVDAILENYYNVIEQYEDDVELLLNESSTGNPETLRKIETVGDTINYLKRALIPIREVVFNLKTSAEDENLVNITSENKTFFARLYQKVLELLEQIEYDSNLLESATNFYFSNQSHKMNEIMKTLTTVSVIFMPLTFIVGVYGMNFRFMPELDTRYGYFVVWGVMLVMVAGMIYYFKRKHWF